MRSPQTLTRRLVPALAVTVFATLVFGAVLVTADAADGFQPLLPESFAVAQPMQGDAWRYNVTLRGDWTFGGEDRIPLDAPLPFGTFQWAGQATVRGGDGRMHDVNRFHSKTLGYRPLHLEATIEEDELTGETSQGEVGPSQDPYWVETGDSGWVLAGGRNIISRGFSFIDAENYTNYGYMPPPASLGLGAYYEKRFMEFGSTMFPVDQVPCLAFNPLQGNNVSLASPVGLFDACRLGIKFLEIPDGLSFQAAAVETIQGIQAVRFDANQNGTYQAWFTPAVPYPVRIAFSLPSERSAILEEGDLDAPGARSAVLEMTGFSPGAQPLDNLDDPSDPSSAPDLVFAAPLVIEGVAVGPDETGIVHPFPLSQAYQAALDAPQFADLRSFLSGKVKAYVAAAEYQEGRYAYNSATSQFSHARTWQLAMMGDGELFGFSVTQESFDNFVPVPARNGTQAPTTYTFDRNGFYGYGWRDLAPANQAPAQLATVQSLIDRWQVFDRSEDAANLWGFAVTCSDGVDPCKMQVNYLAGQRRDTGYYSAGNPHSFFPFPLPSQVFGAQETAHVDRFVQFGGDGTARELRVDDYRSYRSDTQSTLPGEPVPSPEFNTTGDPGYSVQSTAVQGLPPAASAWLPAPKEAASVTFLGVAVGFLYWIWPKLGIMGLFSRLERGELLDHPARAKLVQIVESQPGIHFHELAQKAELANGTAVHHLRKLSDSGHINVRRSGRYTCYFPTGRVDASAALAAPLLKSDGARQVMDAVRAKPGMSNLELAQATGLQPSTVNYHVQRLSQAGLLATLRDGRSVRLHPGTGFAPDAAAA